MLSNILPEYSIQLAAEDAMRKLQYISLSHPGAEEEWEEEWESMWWKIISRSYAMSYGNDSYAVPVTSPSFLPLLHFKEVARVGEEGGRGKKEGVDVVLEPMILSSLANKALTLVLGYTFAIGTVSLVLSLVFLWNFLSRLYQFLFSLFSLMLKILLSLLFVLPRSVMLIGRGLISLPLLLRRFIQRREESPFSSYDLTSMPRGVRDIMLSPSPRRMLEILREEGRSGGSEEEEEEEKVEEEGKDKEEKEEEKEEREMKAEDRIDIDEVISMKREEVEKEEKKEEVQKRIWKRKPSG